MPAKTLSKVMRISGAIALLMLVTVSGIWASYSGFNSRGCYDLVAKNKFTGNIKVYCDYPPWHASVMGGEDARKILLDDCLGRKSEFYLQNPNYCQVYKDDSSRKD